MQSCTEEIEPQGDTDAKGDIGLMGDTDAKYLCLLNIKMEKPNSHFMAVGTVFQFHSGICGSVFSLAYLCTYKSPTLCSGFYTQVSGLKNACKQNLKK